MARQRKYQVWLVVSVLQEDGNYQDEEFEMLDFDDEKELNAYLKAFGVEI